MMDVIKEIRKKIQSSDAVKEINLGPYSITGTKDGCWEFSLSQHSLFPNSLASIGVTMGNDGSIFLHRANFYNLDIPEDLVFLLEYSDKHTIIIFEKCRFAGKLKIRNRKFHNARILSTYEDQQKNKAELGELKFIDCEMHGEGRMPYLRVGFLHARDFVLRNLRIPNGAEVNIGDCYFETCKFSNIRNLGKFKLYKINILEGEETTEGKFQIDNTSIGDADFQSINLESFGTRKIFDNILSGIDYTNVQWETRKSKGDIKVDQYRRDDPEITKLTKLTKQQDTYRTLKNVALKNNDMPQVYACYAKEMEYHHEIIKYNLANKQIDYGIKSVRAWLAKTRKCIYETIKSFLYSILQMILLRYSQERVTLGFSRRTSNFGQSWLRPIGWILGTGVLSYGLLLIFFNGDYDASLWSKFFVFLNPTHSTEFIEDCYWNGCAYFIDFSFRVVEGAFIYQAIQAFRRYSRKF